MTANFEFILFLRYVLEAFRGNRKLDAVSLFRDLATIPLPGDSHADNLREPEQVADGKAAVARPGHSASPSPRSAADTCC